MMLRARIRTLERFFKALWEDVRVIFPSNADDFLDALGVDPEGYKLQNDGYDAIAALEDTAVEDWHGYERSVL